MCVQVAVPLWATWQGVPHKFGFHMFTGYDPLEVTVIDEDGSEVDVDLSEWIVVRREDIDWARRLPSVICADTPDAAIVTVRQWGTSRSQQC